MKIDTHAPTLKKMEGMNLRFGAFFYFLTIFFVWKTCNQGFFCEIKRPKSEEKPKLGVSGVMTLKVTGIATTNESTQKTSAPPPQSNFLTGGPGNYEAVCSPAEVTQARQSLRMGGTEQ